jgi:hypothetical protein
MIPPLKFCGLNCPVHGVYWNFFHNPEVIFHYYSLISMIDLFSFLFFKLFSVPQYSLVLQKLDVRCMKWNKVKNVIVFIVILEIP